MTTTALVAALVGLSYTGQAPPGVERPNEVRYRIDGNSVVLSRGYYKKADRSIIWAAKVDANGNRVITGVDVLPRLLMGQLRAHDAYSTQCSDREGPVPVMGLLTTGSVNTRPGVIGPMKLLKAWGVDKDGNLTKPSTRNLTCVGESTRLI